MKWFGEKGYISRLMLLLSCLVNVDKLDVHTSVIETQKEETISSDHRGQVRLEERIMKTGKILLKPEYVAIGKVLHDFISAENESSMAESGPYGMACNVLGWENSVKNRTYLFTTWKENTGNVRCNVENSLEIHRLRSGRLVSNSRHGLGNNQVGLNDINKTIRKTNLKLIDKSYVNNKENKVINVTGQTVFH